MPKNALFLVKNRKNRRALGLRPQTPLPPAAGGSALRPPQQPPHDEFLATRLMQLINFTAIAFCSL